ncbi:MAG: hydroxylamine reductase [Candidatus Bathyarchaeota archaeon]|nr:MAG: hydroxylamine reductase [Candidatus Bathyarchaeota archaeon]
MFCYQCEQTARGKGCTIFGVCGKTPDVSALIDLQIYTLTGLSQIALQAKSLGIDTEEIDVFTCKALFSTLTNVNFDPTRLVRGINKTVEYRESLKTEIRNEGKAVATDDLTEFVPNQTIEGMIEQGTHVGLKSVPAKDQDALSLKHLLLFGIKGVAAYTDHAYILGQKDEQIYTFIYEGLKATRDKSITNEALIGLALKCGAVNLRAMELLDAGNSQTYGHPTPTQVPLGVKKGKAILVSGHDLTDLEALLKQSHNKGIYVYTHGEMLPTHAYPKLKKHPHFYGHYGTAWQNQQREFQNFPGAILITTNCLMKPRQTYQNNLFTTGQVGWPNIPHIPDKNFAPVIDTALKMAGFQEDQVDKEVSVGFARNTILSVADKVIAAVNNKALRHIILVGGCDGAKPGRNYYAELVDQAPADTLILTLACGKFRFFDKDLGTIGELPRLLDVGQCNDAYSAVKIALALSDAFNVGVNELPLSLVLSWYEQKAVAILLTLLHLGIKDIRLGPSLPAFVTPNILSVLVKNFNIMPTSTPEQDLQAILHD